MTEIQTKGFRLSTKGDTTVGIFPQEWALTGNFSFNGQSELDEFKKSLAEAFEYACDEPVKIVELENQNQ